MRTNIAAQKLKIKDIITVVLLTLINVVIFMVSSLLYLTPITVLAMPVLYGLVEGIVFFTIGARVKKRGAFLIYCAVRGVMGFYLPYILCYLAAGILIELILARTGYGSVKGLSIGYIIAEVLGAIGGTFYPYVIAASSFFANADELLETGELNGNVLEAAQMIRSWGSLALLAAIILASLIGTLIGRRVVKKHLLSEASA